MTSLKTALLVALVLAVACQHVTAFCAPKTVECCEQFRKSPLRLRDLKCFYWTSNECHLNAVVLVTKDGQRSCADPEKRWVKRAMATLPEEREES
ncbi:C-C motif chemokine 22 [Hemicordylus capensis]|uniref:C-C motif chemokine 22 n=1 Tax=Hemicordylus capensis TaxID=884348 RepID=UPI0023048ED3|nr:C-C motif chemokine 22 [Hemicordylus capensis]XP_053127403.1 C-C motif chemokine 22 [Hemicordylus capensis]